MMWFVISACFVRIQGHILTVSDLRRKLVESKALVNNSSAQSALVKCIRRMLTSGQIVQKLNGTVSLNIYLTSRNDLVTLELNDLHREEGEEGRIYCCTKSGCFIDIFQSLEACSDFFQIEEKDIRLCCVGRQKHFGGLSFRWAKVDEDGVIYKGKCSAAFERYREITAQKGPDRRYINEKKSATVDRLKRNLLELVRSLCECDEECTLDSIYTLIIPEFGGKGVLPANVKDILGAYERKHYIILDERPGGDSIRYQMNPQFRRDFETAPVLCLSAYDVGLYIFSSITQVEDFLGIDQSSVLNSILRSPSRTTRNLKFKWLDQASVKEIDDTKNQDDDILDSLGMVVPASDLNEIEVTRERSTRVKQYSSKLTFNGSFEVPHEINEVFKEHEILDSRVARSLHGSSSRNGRQRRRQNPKPVVTASVFSDLKKRYQKPTLIKSGNDDDEDDRSDGDGLPYLRGLESYRKRHNLKPGDFHADLPEVAAFEQSNFDKIDSFLGDRVWCSGLIDADSDRLSRLNEFCWFVKKYAFPAGRILKVNLRSLIEQEDAVTVTTKMRNTMRLVCSLEANADRRLDTKLCVFDGYRVTYVSLDDCFLDNEEDFLHIFWKHHESMSAECAVDTHGRNKCSESFERPLWPSDVEHAVCDYVQKQLNAQWSHREVAELIYLIKKYPGEFDISGRYISSRQQHSSRSRKDIVAFYYSKLCALNRLQSYNHINNVFSCADFFKGNILNPLETRQPVHALGIEQSRDAHFELTEKVMSQHETLTAGHVENRGRLGGTDLPRLMDLSITTVACSSQGVIDETKKEAN